MVINFNFLKGQEFILSKRVLVTGGASSIGKGVVKKYLKNNYHVIILDKDEKKLAKTVTELNEFNSKFHPIVCDLQDVRDIKDKVDKAYAYWDGLDILVNNAGFAIREPFIDIPIENWDQIMEVNLRGTFALSQMITKHMI